MEIVQQIALLLDGRSLYRLALTLHSHLQLLWTKEFRSIYSRQHKLTTCMRCSKFFPIQWHQRVHHVGRHKNRLTQDRTSKYLRILDDLLKEHGLKASQDDDDILQFSSEELDKRRQTSPSQ